jgi:hypothetical protein
MRLGLLIMAIAIVLGSCGINENAPNEQTITEPGRQPSASQTDYDDAVQQLVGGWIYQVCNDDGDCESVVRVYEESPAHGLVRYTEYYNGAENEGVVKYDLRSEAFIEIDYPQEWSHETLERRYLSEEVAIDLFGAYQVGHPDRRTMEWRIDEEGDRLYLRAFGSELQDEPSDILNVIFSRMPLVGEDPVVGPARGD